MSKHTKAKTPKPAAKAKSETKGKKTAAVAAPVAAAPKAKRAGKSKSKHKAAAAPVPAPLEPADAREKRLAAAPALTTEGVATHKIEITAYAFTAEQAARIAKHVEHMFTGSEAKISEISRDLPAAAPEAAPAAASAETGAPADTRVVTPPAAAALEESRAEEPAPEPLKIPEGEFRDKSHTACVVTVISSTAKEFRVKEKESGKEWNVPNVLWGAAYEPVPAAE